MALSNWDCMAWDSKGKPCRGELTLPNGYSVEIYKNWVYILKGGQQYYQEEITEGHVKTHCGDINVEVIAARGKQIGVYVYVSYSDYTNKVEDSMCGIGVYGYNTGPTVDIFWFKYTRALRLDRILPKRWAYAIWQLKFYRSKYVGVKPSTERHFRKWLKAVAKEEGLKLPPLETGKRFNWGDLFFAGTLGTECNATNAGDANKETVFTKLLKAGKNTK